MKDYAEALRILRKIERDGKEFDLPPWMNHVVSAYKARIWLETGNPEEIQRWVNERGLIPGEKLSCRREPEHMILSQILISQNEHADADRLLQKLIQNAESGSRMASVLEMRVIRAAGLHGQGKLEASLDELKKALSVGEPGGFVNVFVMSGQIIVKLLKKILEGWNSDASYRNAGFSYGYVKKLIQAFERIKVPKKVEGLIEPLSERELEVLQLISAGLTNKEIAEKLFVSLNTVRTHTKNINRKLDVHSRTQATARAKKLGLL